MKRDYSFNEISQITMGPTDSQTRNLPPPYHTSSKHNKESWTDMRVEEIKRKYDTPSHRKTPSNYGLHQKSRQHQPEVSTSNPFTSYRNALRDSIASPNIAKKDYTMSTNNHVATFKDQSFQKSSWQDKEHVPRFSYDSKQNSSFLDKFAHIKNSMKIDTKPQNKENTKYKDYPPSKIDPRVQNIDKINLKIKRILDCLHQNESYANEKGIRQQQLKSSFLKGSIMSKGGQSDDMEETKILSRQKFALEKESNAANNPPMRSSIMKNQRYSLSPQVKQESSSKWRLQQKYNNIKSSQAFPNEQSKNIANINEEAGEQSSSWFESNKNRDSRNRARSCLGNFKHQQIQLHSGKKLDDEIIKINARIKEFEEQKKKLNIQFKPYHYEMKSNKSTSNLTEHRTQRGSKPPLPKPSTNKTSQYSAYNKKYNIVDKLKTEEDEPQSRYNMEARRSYNYDQYKPSSRLNSLTFKMQAFDSYKAQQKRQKTSTPEFEQKQCDSQQQRKVQQNANQDACSNELKQKTEQGIEQRKRKLLETATVTFSRQTKRLITNLFEQVKLDEDLRNAKIWYRDLSCTNKADLLKKQLQKVDLNMDEIQLQVSEQEDNPFYSVRDGEQSYASLVDRWSKAEKYWKQNIQGQYDLNEFVVEKFTNEKLDLERKGYFVVQDLVRFLNMETGTFYRNRDLILVFRRLCSGSKLHWEEFLSILDQQH